jgi:hypothetical protein
VTIAQLREQIAQHPWEAVAFGALTGVWLGAHAKASRKPRGLVMGLLGAVALQLVREKALVEMGKFARSMMTEMSPQPPRPTPYAS